jgi:hypothetical protein
MARTRSSTGSSGASSSSSPLRYHHIQGTQDVVIILFFFIVFHYKPSFSVLGPIIIARYETGPKQVAEKDI